MMSKETADAYFAKPTWENMSSHSAQHSHKCSECGFWDDCFSIECPGEEEIWIDQCSKCFANNS